MLRMSRGVRWAAPAPATLPLCRYACSRPRDRHPTSLAHPSHGRRGRVGEYPRGVAGVLGDSIVPCSVPTDGARVRVT